MTKSQLGVVLFILGWALLQVSGLSSTSNYNTTLIDKWVQQECRPRGGKHHRGEVGCFTSHVLMWRVDGHTFTTGEFVSREKFDEATIGSKKQQSLVDNNINPLPLWCGLSIIGVVSLMMATACLLWWQDFTKETLDE